MTTELIIPEGRDLKKLFTAPEATDLETVLKDVEARARSETADVNTKAGRAALRTLAMQVAHCKTGLEEAAVICGKAAKTVTDGINARRRDFKARLDALRDEVRKPLTDWETAEDERVAVISGKIDKLREIVETCANWNVAAAEDMLERVKLIPADEDTFAEFADIGIPAHADAVKALEAAIDAGKVRDAEAAELAELRAESEARAEADRLAREADEQTARDEEAERQRVAQAEAAEVERVKREAKIKADAEAAERQRITAEAEAERKQDERRAANKRHRAKVRREAAAGFLKRFDNMGEAECDALVAAIEEGEIPHVQICF
jgi:hypothetical protein